MSTTTAPPRSFHPLNGEETRKVMVAKLDATLADDMAFRQCLAYPMFRYEITVRMECYPEPPEINVTASGTVKAKMDPAVIVVKGGGNVEAPLEGPMRPILEVEQRGQSPDEAREAAGLPVPRTRSTQFGPVDVFEELAKTRGGKKS